MIKELGGKISDWKGNDLNINSDGRVVASYEANHHKKVITLLKMQIKLKIFLIIIIQVNILFFGSSLSEEINYQHGIAMHGDLKYDKDFRKFDYANEEAYKGGEIKLSAIGTFDNLNPYILKGVAAYQSAYLFETLMKSSFDEPFSQYGLIAEGVKVPKDRSWVTFKIRDEAKFSDGTKILPEDVIFSFNIITTKGHPIYKTYYGQVDKVLKISENEVKFTFKGEPNPELPLIIGYQLPTFSKIIGTGKEFNKTTLTPPLGSGPYLISDLKPGRSITLKKNPNYWGQKINVNVGRFNFETIHTDFYRDRQSPWRLLNLEHMILTRKILQKIGLRLITLVQLRTVR